MVKPEYGTIAAFFRVKRLEQRSEYEVRGPVLGGLWRTSRPKKVVKGKPAGTAPIICSRLELARRVAICVRSGILWRALAA